MKLRRTILSSLLIMGLLIGMILHGCSANSTSADITDRMSKSHQNDQPVATTVIAPDMRGYGDLEKPETDYDAKN